MRSYASTIVLENVFDALETTKEAQSHDVQTLMRMVFFPTVPIVETDCLTLLGDVAQVRYEKRGLQELYSGATLSDASIKALLSSGVYKVSTRTTGTCIASGGICAHCAAQAYLGTITTSSATLPPIFVKTEELVYPDAANVYSLSLDSTEYTAIKVYGDSALVPPNLVAVSGNDLTISAGSPSVSTGIVVRYLAESRVPYFLWLAAKYSGSLLGAQPIPGPKLPVRPLLLASMIDTSVLSAVVDELSTYPAPEDLIQYTRGIHDVLERALMALALVSLYNTSV